MFCHTQVLLPLLKSDLYEVILNTMNGKLATSAPVWQRDSSAVTVVMAAAGYPGSYDKGVPIKGGRDSQLVKCKFCSFCGMKKASIMQINMFTLKFNDIKMFIAS